MLAQPGAVALERGEAGLEILGGYPLGQLGP